MRKAMLCVAVIGLASMLWAADPSVGTWKLNVAKSKFSGTSTGPTKEGTVVVRELGTDEFELTSSGTAANGSKTSGKETWPQKGGVVKSSSAAAGESDVVTMIAPGEWYDTTMQNGKQTGFIHSSISKDGKTMTAHVKGTDTQGKPYEHMIIFERQ
jgi:hypothetical protein